MDGKQSTHARRHAPRNFQRQGSQQFTSKTQPPPRLSKNPRLSRGPRRHSPPPPFSQAFDFGHLHFCRGLTLRQRRFLSSGDSHSYKIHLCPWLSSSTMASFQVVRIDQHRPLNSVHLSLDGTQEQVYRNYIACRDHYRKWNIEMAILHENNVSRVFTTPTGFTFYYAMSYDQRCLIFVVEGRNGWLHGYYATKGIYEFANSSRKEPYINHPGCCRLPFEGNHHVISPCIGQTSIGLYALRDAFNTIWEYNGGAEHVGLRAAFGIIVVHVCESLKLQPVFDRICEAFVNQSVRKLAANSDNFIRYLIIHWRRLSTHAMRAFSDPGYKFHIRDFPHISSVLDILPHLTVLHIDGWFDGPFKHDKATNPSHWEPLEPGTDVPSIDDIHG